MIPPDTCKEIDRVVERTLRDAGLSEPPILIEDLLAFLELDRDFYDLDDPSFLDRFLHQLKLKKRTLIIAGRKLLTRPNLVLNFLRKIKLGAFWFPDQARIVVDASLPKPKQVWASFHDILHARLEWHRQFFIGDTIESLEPEYREMLEAEANYGCSALMFGGEIFTREALDTTPCWESVALLNNRHKNSGFAPL